jgi:hypothetical protein
VVAELAELAKMVSVVPDIVDSTLFSCVFTVFDFMVLKHFNFPFKKIGTFVNEK